MNKSMYAGDVQSWIGKNTDWKVSFHAATQIYYVYYKKKLFAKKFKFSDVKSYLD